VRECNIDQMLSERCDGNRNILHACVAACAPSSNKDLDAGLSQHIVVIVLEIQLLLCSSYN